MTGFHGSVPVLVIGAGPSGLSTAIELGRRGIRCLVIEQNDRVGYNPRAKLTNVRSMEHLHRWGIADRLRAANPMPSGHGSDIVFATRLTGYSLAGFTDAFNTAPEKNDFYSERATWVPQYTLEAVLRDYAAELPSVDFLFSTRFVSASESSDGVEVLLEGADGQFTTQALFLIGADGARSSVRKQLGIEMTGTYAFSRNFNVLFRAPQLRELHQKPFAIQYWLVNKDVPALMGPMDDDDLWYIIATRLGSQTDFERIDPHELIAQAVGAPVDIAVVSVDPWVAHLLIANTYGTDRIKLAGDACHLHPPFGGFGMNLGIGDGVDLGWKLAAMLQGWGGPHLLESYEAERKPVHRQTMDEAMENYSTVGNELFQQQIEYPGSQGDRVRAEVGERILKTKEREFRSLGIVLGYRYANASTIIPDGTEPPPYDVKVYSPSAAPGCLAPHHWYADGSSLYDHFGAGFTLVLQENADVPGGLLEAARKRDIPLSSVVLSGENLAARYGARYVLVRPDQHVAWRSNDDVSTPEDLWDHVCGYVSSAVTLSVTDF